MVPDVAQLQAEASDRVPLATRGPLLRSHANLDAAAGTVSLHSQILVRDGRIRGYIKPLLRDVDLYDPRQDRDDGVLHRIYEFVADGVRRILENQRDDTIATVADLSGPVQDPRASTWEVIRNLARNAFVQALQPGFEQGARRPGSRRTSAPRPTAPPAPRDAPARRAS